jgi:hypothetical protein
MKLDCTNGPCKSRTEPVACPTELALEAEQLFFAQDNRVYAFDRERRQLRQLSKRKRRPREVTVKGKYVYWFEGDPHAEIWRVVRDGSTPAELLARRQVSARALSISDDQVYWVAVARSGSSEPDAGGGPALFALPIPTSGAAASPAK